jgi:valyl-tRNA synthetase
VAVCYKCGSIIEPMILDNQWFVKTTSRPKNGGLSLRDAAIIAVKKKQIKFIPPRFEKIFFHWLKNIRDWNISRQIVWGIKIPDKNTADVFDTWFSSGQWPFATLMTAKPHDFKKFYPTNVLETGPDILFFWVARMIMLGLYVTGKTPFEYVYLHGLVRDKDKQKMSKSKGNVIDPLGVIDIYGSDALRMALVVGNAPGNDPVIYEEKIRGYRNFANKIWNASRFALMQIGNSKLEIRNSKQILNSKFQTAADKRILEALNKTIKSVTKNLDNFQFHRASHILYHFFWHDFCDIYLEESKKQLQATNSKQQTTNILIYVLLTSLKLLHPFMPFITEEIYQRLPVNGKKECLMIEEWPRG